MAGPDLSQISIPVEIMESFAGMAEGSCLWWDTEIKLCMASWAYNEPPTPDCLYLMSWNAAWLEQWVGDWQAAVEYLFGVLISTPGD